MTIKTSKDLTRLATLAGIDLAAHGAKAAFARMLGVPTSYVSTALIAGGTLPGRLCSPALALAAQLASGAVAPTGATRPAQTEPADAEPELVVQTDAEVLAEINERFATMDRFVDLLVRGKFPVANSVCITGPGGIGKTYPVESYLREYQAANPNRVVIMISGAVSAVGLVEALWNTRNKGDVLLIDDADGGLENIDFLNVLKAATDTKGRRVVSWCKQNKSLAEAGVESQFEYEGSVIVISNANMAAVADGTTKRAGHMDAVLSRAIGIDLGINSKRALALRVNDMITAKGMLAQTFARAGMGHKVDEGTAEIAAFIAKHAESFRSLTLREAAKIADMYLACEGKAGWTTMARLSLGL